MENQEQLLSTKAGLNAAKYSFIIGTIIFLAFCITGHEGFTMIGLFYVICSFFINSLILLVLIISLITNSDKYLEILKTMAIVLLNIPIAWFYFYIVTTFF